MIKKKKGHFKLFITLLIIIGLYILVSNLNFEVKEKLEYDYDNLTKENRVEILEELKKDVKKKHKGKKGDKESPEILKAELWGHKVDLKEKIYPSLELSLKDISGIFRVRVLIFNNKEFIGYIQDNPNTKEEEVNLEFKFDNRIVLDQFKTLKDFEGSSISYGVEVWDNNMNKATLEPKKEIKIVDRTAPKKIKAFWTYHYNIEKSKVKMYNKNKENYFEVYKTEDLPKIKGNKVVKYQYGLLDKNGKVLLRVGVDPFEEKKTKFTIEVDNEGENIFYVRAIDKNKNIEEKQIKFYCDFTPPVGELVLPGGIQYKPREEFDVVIKAKDDLSGVFRYRLASDEKKLLDEDWKDIESIVKYRADIRGGIREIWAQFQDNAFNKSKPINISYYSKVRRDVGVVSTFEDREVMTEFKKSELKRGNLKVKSIKEN